MISLLAGNSCLCVTTLPGVLSTCNSYQGANSHEFTYNIRCPCFRPPSAAAHHRESLPRSLSSTPACYHVAGFHAAALDSFSPPPPYPVTQESHPSCWVAGEITKIPENLLHGNCSIPASITEKTNKQTKLWLYLHPC